MNDRRKRVSMSADVRVVIPFPTERARVRRLVSLPELQDLRLRGPAPGEALALRFEDIGARTIAVDKAVSDGKEGPTKTGRARSAPLAPALREVVEHWKHLRAPPGDHELFFPARRSGLWSRSEFNNWRNRVWKPVLQGLASLPTLVSLAAARPYDCRASFVSLQLRAGASPLEVAQWAGHSPAVMFRHYAHVIDELVGEPILPVDEQILRARRVVEAKEKEELDRLVADLLEHPTVTEPGQEQAATILYQPN
jgi:integrase